MKGKMLFILGGAALVMVSCNSMPTITTNVAIQLAEEMVKRQDRDFGIGPENYINEEFIQMNAEEKHEYGLWQNNMSDTNTEFFDLANIRYRYFHKHYQIGHISENDEIHFYENHKIYHLHNDNGYKWRIEEDCQSEERAKLALLEIRDERTIKKIQWRQMASPEEETLDNFAKWANNYDRMRKEYEREQEKHKDEYIKTEYKSSSADTLQVIIDTRIKKEILEDVAPEESRSRLHYIGLITSNKNRILKNDMTTSIHFEESFNCPATENKDFYKKRESKSITKFSYDKAVITLPNIEEYVPVIEYGL